MSSSTLTILLPNAKELDKIYRGISQLWPHLDNSRLFDLAIVPLFADVAFLCV
jgi:hypothetical protein